MSNEQWAFRSIAALIIVVVFMHYFMHFVFG